MRKDRRGLDEQLVSQNHSCLYPKQEETQGGKTQKLLQVCIISTLHTGKWSTTFVTFVICISDSFLPKQLRSLLTRSILSYVEIFTDPRKLPRIEMELVLQGNKVCFSPSISEVSEMILSVISEVTFKAEKVMIQKQFEKWLL